MGSIKKKSFLASFFSLGVGSLIYLVVGLIGTPIITRLVDPVDYGNMSMLTVYSNIGLMALGLGLDQTLLRYYYQNENIDYKRKLLYECFGIPIILSVVVGIAAIVVIAWGNRSGLVSFTVEELILLELNVIVLIIHRYSALLVRLRYHTNLYSVINIVQKALYILFTIILVLSIRSHYYEILAVSTIVSTLIASLIGIIKEKDLWHFKRNDYVFPISVSELLKYSIPIMFSSGIVMIFNALDKLSIDHFCTRADVGVYTSAMNLMAVFTVVRNSFNALWMPSAVEHYEKNKTDKTFFQRGNTFITLFMFLFGAALILVKDAFVLLLGNKYREASSILPFLMFEPIMYTISETTATGIVVQKKSTYQVIVAAVSCMVNFIGNWTLTPLIGPKGAAISTGLSYIVFFALRTMLSNRVFYVDYKLKRFSIITVLLVLYAFYGSSNAFSFLQIVLFSAIVAFMVVLYRGEFVEAMQYGKVIISKVRKK